MTRATNARGNRAATANKLPAILQAAIESFEEIGTLEIEVPEWTPKGQKDPYVIYYNPMTLTDQSHFSAKRAAGMNDVELLVDVLIVKALNDVGERLFTEVHKRHFMTKVDPAVVVRVAKVIANELSAEEAEGNSEATPN